MSKRKLDDSEEQDIVNVNFDYYDIRADNDYHAINRLFIQLFAHDAERVQTGPLTDLVTRVAEESGVGSTIKTEEEEGSDPYAILTVISCQAHAGLQRLMDYLLSKTSTDAAFHGTLTSLLQAGHVGLVLSERLVNMPVQVMPPMYKMLSEEIDAAVGVGWQGRGYDFTHYLFVSRVYRREGEYYGYHLEDGEIMEVATHGVTYGFTDGPGDGVVAGRAMLVPVEKLRVLVRKLEATYS